MPTNLHLFLDCHLQGVIEVTRELMGSAIIFLPGALKMLLDAQSQSSSAWMGVLQDGVEHGFNSFGLTVCVRLLSEVLSFCFDGIV